MANIKSAKKRITQSEIHRKRNIGLKSSCRTYIKKMEALVTSNNKDGATKAFKDTVSMIDKMVTKGILHKNKAARHKSNLSNKIKKLL
ncbi:MAG: 30S ribosomal protein S20 [Coxiellaceae bacterium]|nr:30S ribosomal protein S20 [Coxiellaceae bacterium]